MKSQNPTQAEPSRALPTLAITLGIQSLVAMAAVTLPVLAPLMADGLGKSATLLAGMFSAIVYLGAMASALASGTLVRRLGAIRASQVGLLLCAIGLLLCSLPWFAGMIAGSFLVGLGYGPITPASSHLLIRTTPPRYLSLIFSVKQTGVPFGALLAGAIAPPLGLGAGWQTVLWMSAGVCALFALITQTLRRSLDSDRNRSERMQWVSFIQPVKLVLSHRVLRRLALCSFLFALAQMALTAFLVTYLHEDKGMGLVAAGLFLSIAQGAGVVGRIAWGYISDAWLGPRRTLTLLALVMAASALSLAALPQGAPEWSLATVLVAFGATAVGWNGVYLSEVARQAPQGLAGTATGGTLMFTFLGNVVGPALLGIVAASLGGLDAAYAALALPLTLAGWLLYRTAELRK